MIAILSDFPIITDVDEPMSSIPINRRINDIATLFSSLGLDFFKDLETRDPQYKAISKLRHIDPPVIPVMVSLNALVSFMLSCRGEDYWYEFSCYVMRNFHKVRSNISIKAIIDFLIDFLVVSKCNRRFLNMKIKRLLRIRSNPEAKRLMDINFFLRDTLGFWKLLANLVGSKPESKTTVFSVKMYYYGIRSSLNLDMVLPFEIPIPVDRRIIRVTSACGLLKKPKDVGWIRDIWSLIGKLSGIPPLHLDVLLWLISPYIEFNDIVLAAKSFSREFNVKYDISLKIFNVLLPSQQ